MKKYILLLLTILLMATSTLALDNSSVVLNAFPNNVTTSSGMYGGITGGGNNTNYYMNFDGSNDYLSTTITSLDNCEGYYNNSGNWSLTTTPFYISGTVLHIGKTSSSNYWQGQLRDVECFDSSSNSIYNNSLDALTDLSSNYINMNANNGLAVTNENSWVFDDVNDYSSIDTDLIDNELYGASGVSFSMWLKRSSTNDAFVFYSQTTASNTGLDFYIDNSNHLRLTARSRTDDAGQAATGSTNLNAGVWYHVVGIADFENDKLYTYINGVGDVNTNVNFGSNTLQWFANSATLSSTSTSYAYLGALSNFMVFNKTLTSTEVTELYTNGRAYEYFPRAEPVPPTPVLEFPYEEMNILTQSGTTIISSVSYQNILTGTVDMEAGLQGYISYQINAERLANPANTVTCNIRLNGVILDAESSNTLTSLGDIKQTYKHTTVVNYSTTNDIDLICRGSSTKQIEISNANVIIREFHDTKDYNFSVTSEELTGSVSDIVNFVAVINKTVTVPYFNVTDTNRSTHYIFDTAWVVDYDTTNTAEGYLEVDGEECPMLQRYGAPGNSGSAGYFCILDVENKTEIDVLFYVKGDVDLSANLIERFNPIDSRAFNQTFASVTLDSTDWVQISNVSIEVVSADNDIFTKASISSEATAAPETATYRFRLVNTSSQESLRYYSTVLQPGMVTAQNLFTTTPIGNYTLILEGKTETGNNVEVINSTFLAFEVGESDINPNSFTITALDTIFSEFVQSFGVADGLTLTTTTGAIEYPKQNNLINLTFFADNYFNVTELNHNTTNNLEYPAIPYPWMNLTAKSIIDESAVSDFTVNCDSYGNVTADGTYLMYQLQEARNNTNVECLFYHPGFANSNFTVTGLTTDSITDYEIFAYTTNSVNFTFVDSESGLPVLENVTIELIGTMETYSAWTEDGWVYLDLINPDTYTARYDAFGYNQNFFSFTMVNKTTSQITLYMSSSNSTEVVTANVIDEKARAVEGVLIKVFKESFTNSTEFILDQMATTNFEGVTQVNLVTDTKLYYFVLEYPTGITKQITNPTYIYDSTLNFQIVIGSLPGQDYTDYLKVYSDLEYVQIDNVTDSFEFEWNDGNNLATKGCIRLYDSRPAGETLVGEQCSNGISGDVTYSYTIPTNTIYRAEGVLYFDGVYTVYQNEKVEYLGEQADTGKNGMFMILLLVILFGTLLASKPTLLLLFVPVPLELAKWAGLINIDWGIIIGIHFVFVAIAYLISDRG